MRRVKYLIWTMPAGILTLLASFSLIMQSCSIPVVIRPDGRFVNVEYLYTPFIIYGVVLFIGTCFSVFSLVQVGRISKRLKDLGYSI